ncbi:MAG: V-type ATP synthase subunit E [Pseudomonadota bacterium]
MSQVEELENAILSRARELAEQHAEQARRSREMLLREASERVRQREKDAEAHARERADQHYRQTVQTAELRLRSQLDRTRWNLVRGVERRLAERMRSFIQDEAAYREHLQALITDNATLLPSDALTVRANAVDSRRLEDTWDKIQKQLPDKSLRLGKEPIETLAGVLLTSDDGRVRVNHTFEGRLARLQPMIQQIILEHLFPTPLEAAGSNNGSTS